MTPDPAPPPPLVDFTEMRPIQSLRPMGITMNGGNGVTVSINQQTGEVKITGGDVNEGARAFWEAVQRMFPGCRTGERP